MLGLVRKVAVVTVTIWMTIMLSSLRIAKLVLAADALVATAGIVARRIILKMVAKVHFFSHTKEEY